MKSELIEGRLHVHRTSEEREPLLRRLGRIEGQVRGLSQMIASDRYCRDELQVASAILAALKSVMRLLVAQHIRAGIGYLGEYPDGLEEVMADFDAVLIPLLKEQ